MNESGSKEGEDNRANEQTKNSKPDKKGKMEAFVVVIVESLKAASCWAVLDSLLRTVGQNNQKYRLKYWATHLSIHLFLHTAHSFTYSALLASLAGSAALTHSLARSLRSLPCSWEIELSLDFFLLV